MTVKYLVVVDPIERIQPRFDTSLRLTREALRRGIEVDWCDLTRADSSLSAQEYLRSLPVRKVEKSQPEQTPFIVLGEERRARVEEYQVILQRKDPPVDDFYKIHSQKFSAAPKRIVQMNNPDQTWRYSEHALPAEYPQYSIPTFLCKGRDAFIRAVRRQKPEAVAKPENECSGIGVTFFATNTPESELTAYWEKWGPEIIVQPYMDEITKSGDLRILTFRGKILGSVMRVARPGSRLANLHQGASSQAFNPTPHQREAAKFVGEDLAKKGLHLLGLDFIGEQLSEINITSPSALVQINEVMNKRTEVELLNEIEALRYLAFT